MSIRTIVSTITILLSCQPAMTLAERNATHGTNETALETSGVIRDVVYLKNGSIIRGTILEMIPDSTIRIQTADQSVFVYPMKDVERIVKEETQPPQGNQPPMELPGAHRLKTQLGSFIGYGTEDGYNFGFGVRVGSTSSSGVYFGGIFVYHLGKSQDFSLSTGFSNYSFRVTVNSLYVGPELGYDARASENLIVRPTISCGYISLMAKAEAGGNSSSTSLARFYVAPGMMFNVLASEKAMIGFDGRYVIVTGEEGSNANAFGIFLALGIIL